MVPSEPQSPPPSDFRVRLFGTMQVQVQGQLLPPMRTRSVAWLLALLILRQGRTVERAWLAGALWPESEHGQALANLRNDLMFLRKALGAEAQRITSPSRDTLQFDLQDADVDVSRFDAAVQTQEEEALHNAVVLYRGPLLEGCFELWAEPERGPRERACLRALETLASRAEARADFQEADVFYRRALTLDALDAPAQRGLMRALAASGDTAGALMNYRDYRFRLHREMNLEPDAETTALFRQLLAEVRRARPPAPAAPAVPEKSGTRPLTAASLSPLPHPLTTLFGREQAVQEIAELVVGSRMVTLVGGGGIGKTRLAIQTAGELTDAFTDGIAFIALAPLADPALLLVFIASVLGVREEANAQAERLLQSLADHLSPRSILLVLDNCEHLSDAAAILAQSLLERCPALHILATSRQRLSLMGEIAWRVPSLACSDPEALSLPRSSVAEQVLASPAAQLFMDRAKMARPGYRPKGRQEAVAVAQICWHLDGMPLAIELAAARIAMLTAGQIASRLGDRFRLLTGGSRAAPPRHQTLRALMDWSYDLLILEERILLRRLCVFAGGWTLEAAEVMGDAQDTLDQLASLTDKSLALADERESGMRYRLPETVREYALEKLRESGEEQATRERHADYYLTLAEQAEASLTARLEPVWLNRLEIEHDNLRAALIYYDAQEAAFEKAVRLSMGLEDFWSTRGYFYERRYWHIHLAERPTPPTAARVRLLKLAGSAALYADQENQGLAIAKRMWTERLEIARQLDDQIEISGALTGLSHLESDPVAARKLAEESLAIVRQLGDRQGLAHSLYHLGHLARKRGDKDAARAHWMECMLCDQEAGGNAGHVIQVLGDLALECGDYSAARDFFRRFVSGRHELGDRWCVVWGMEGLGALALAERQPERAARIWGATLALNESSTSPLSEETRAAYEARKHSLLAAGDETTVLAAWEAGRAMSYEQGLEFAMAADTAADRPVTPQ